MIRGCFRLRQCEESTHCRWALAAAEALPSPEDIPPQAPVPHEAEHRISEGGRLVVLEKEVPHPGKRVRLHEGHGKQPPPLGQQCGDPQHGRERDSLLRAADQALVSGFVSRPR